MVRTSSTVDRIAFTEARQGLGHLSNSRITLPHTNLERGLATAGPSDLFDS